MKHTPQALTKENDLFNQSVGVFQQQFVQHVTLFGRQVLVVGEQEIAVVPQLLMLGGTKFFLLRFCDRTLEGFAICGQSFIQMTMNVLHDMKEVVLNLGLRIHGMDRAGVSDEKVNVTGADVSHATHPQPTQNGLNLPAGTLFQAKGKKHSVMFIPHEEFPILRAFGFVLVQMQRGYLFFSLRRCTISPTDGSFSASAVFQRSKAEGLVSTW